MKKGQTTLFVVLGIVIVVIAGIGYSFREQIITAASGSSLTKAETLPPQFAEKRTAVEECISAVLNQAILTISVQGGYAGESPSGSYMLGELPIAYHFSKGVDLIPTKEVVAEQIAKAMQKEVTACATIIDLPEPKTAKVQVKVDDEKVTATVNMPLKVEINDVTQTVSVFTVTTKTGLGRTLSAIKAIIEWQIVHPKSMCLTCMNEVAVQNDLDISIQSQSGAVLVTATDKKIKIEEQPLKFIFAMAY